MESVYILVIIIGIINIALLLLLLHVYVLSYKKTKSKFAFGLMLFASLFLVNNVIFSLFLVTHKAFHSNEIEFPFAVLSLIQLAAFSTLLKITWK